MKLLLPLILLTAPLASNAERVKAVEKPAAEVQYVATCSNGNKVKFRAGADLSRSSSEASESCKKAGFGKAVSVSASAQSRSSLKATDHNSSRSNKTSHTPLAATDAGQGDSDSGDATKATDYNSSRSNKSFSASDINDADGSDESEESNGTRATDYNSSRSNKADSAKEEADDEVEEKGKSKRKD